MEFVNGKTKTTFHLSISTTDHANSLQRISNPHPKRKIKNAHLSVHPHLFLTHLREILILTLNLLLDPQQHGSLPLVQFLHLIELEQTVCENILVAGFDCFFEIVEELEFAGGGELCVFGAVFVKGAGGGYHVLWRKGVRRDRYGEEREEVGGRKKGGGWEREDTYTGG